MTPEPLRLLRRVEVDLAAVLGTTGITLAVIGIAQLVPVAVALWLDAPALPLLLAALATIAAGAALLPLRAAARKWTRRESLAIVGASWLAATLAGAAPFVALGACGPVDAVLESASGLTTTGATIFVDVERLTTFAPATPPGGPDPRVAALHLWRAMEHWIGGAGIVLIVLVLTPFLADAQMLRQTRSSEASLLTERYRGSTRATVKGLLVVYVGATALNAALLMGAGLSAWDALLHAFATIATGGFSNRTASLGAWGDAVQLITLAFMVLGALNFAVLGRAFEEVRSGWRHARRERGAVPALGALTWTVPRTFVRALWRSGEARAYLAMLAAASLLLAGVLFALGRPERYLARGADGLWQALVDAAFNVGSISSTTGFVTEDFARWPPVCQGVLVALMVIGGCAGSTAGGVKMRRVLIVAKYARRETRRFAHPRAVFPITLGDAVIDDDQVREALGYVSTYAALVVLCALVLALTGADPLTAGSAAVSAFGSVGPGLGDCGPASNFQGFTVGAKLTLTFAMLLGRLEVYPLLTLLLPSFWVRRAAR